MLPPDVLLSVNSSTFNVYFDHLLSKLYIRLQYCNKAAQTLPIPPGTAQVQQQHLCLQLFLFSFSDIEVCLINRSSLKGAWSLYNMLYSVYEELCCF